MERPAFRAVSQGLFPGFLSLVLMTPVSGLPPPAPLPPSPLRPPRTSEPARLPLPLPPPGRLRCPDSGTWGTAPALLAPRAAFATAGSGFWASAGGGRWPGRPEPEIWYPGRGRGPLGPEGRLCDRGIWFLGICRQEGAGPAGRGHHLTLACVLEQDSNRALQQLLSVSNTCSGQVLDFSNTSSCPLSPFRLRIGIRSAGSKAPKQC